MDNLTSDMLTISFAGDTVNISSSSAVLAKSNIDISSTHEGTTLKLRPMSTMEDTVKEENATIPNVTHEMNDQPIEITKYEAEEPEINKTPSDSLSDESILNEEPIVNAKFDALKGDSGYLSDLLGSPQNLSVFQDDTSSIDTVIENTREKPACTTPPLETSSESNPNQLYFFDDDSFKLEVPTLETQEFEPDNTVESIGEGRGELVDKDENCNETSLGQSSLVLSCSGSHENILDDESDNQSTGPLFQV